MAYRREGKPHAKRSLGGWCGEGEGEEARGTAGARGEERGTGRGDLPIHLDGGLGAEKERRETGEKGAAPASKGDWRRPDSSAGASSSSLDESNSTTMTLLPSFNILTEHGWYSPRIPPVVLPSCNPCKKMESSVASAQDAPKRAIAVQSVWNQNGNESGVERLEPKWLRSAVMSINTDDDSDHDYDDNREVKVM